MRKYPSVKTSHIGDGWFHDFKQFLKLLALLALLLFFLPLPVTPHHCLPGVCGQSLAVPIPSGLFSSAPGVRQGLLRALPGAI